MLSYQIFFYMCFVIFWRWGIVLAPFFLIVSPFLEYLFIHMAQDVCFSQWEKGKEHMFISAPIPLAKHNHMATSSCKGGWESEYLAFSASKRRQARENSAWQSQSTLAIFTVCSSLYLSRVRAPPSPLTSRFAPTCPITPSLAGSGSGHCSVAAGGVLGLCGTTGCNWLCEYNFGIVTGGFWNEDGSSKGKHKAVVLQFYHASE